MAITYTETRTTTTTRDVPVENPVTYKYIVRGTGSPVTETRDSGNRLRIFIDVNSSDAIGRTTQLPTTITEGSIYNVNVRVGGTVDGAVQVWTNEDGLIDNSFWNRDSLNIDQTLTEREKRIVSSLKPDAEINTKSNFLEASVNAKEYINNLPAFRRGITDMDNANNSFRKSFFSIKLNPIVNLQVQNITGVGNRLRPVQTRVGQSRGVPIFNDLKYERTDGIFTFSVIDPDFFTRFYQRNMIALVRFHIVNPLLQHGRTDREFSNKWFYFDFKYLFDLSEVRLGTYAVLSTHTGAGRAIQPNVGSQNFGKDSSANNRYITFEDISFNYLFGIGNTFTVKDETVDANLIANYENKQTIFFSIQDKLVTNRGVDLWNTANPANKPYVIMDMIYFASGTTPVGVTGGVNLGAITPPRAEDVEQVRQDTGRRARSPRTSNRDIVDVVPTPRQPDEPDEPDEEPEPTPAPPSIPTQIEQPPDTTTQTIPSSIPVSVRRVPEAQRYILQYTPFFNSYSGGSVPRSAWQLLSNNGSTNTEFIIPVSRWGLWYIFAVWYIDAGGRLSEPVVSFVWFGFANQRPSIQPAVPAHYNFLQIPAHLIPTTEEPEAPPLPTPVPTPTPDTPTPTPAPDVSYVDLRILAGNTNLVNEYRAVFGGGQIRTTPNPRIRNIPGLDNSAYDDGVAYYDGTYAWIAHSDNLWRVSNPFGSNPRATRIHSNGFELEEVGSAISDVYGITNWSPTELLLNVNHLHSTAGLFSSARNKAFITVNKRTGIATHGFLYVKNTSLADRKEPIMRVGSNVYICYSTSGTRALGRIPISRLNFAFSRNPLTSGGKLDTSKKRSKRNHQNR